MLMANEQNCENSNKKVCLSPRSEWGLTSFCRIILQLVVTAKRSQLIKITFFKVTLVVKRKCLFTLLGAQEDYRLNYDFVKYAIEYLIHSIIFSKCITLTAVIRACYLVHLAAAEGHLPCVKFLVCSGVSIDHSLNARNDQGETPVDLCRQMQKKDCMDYLNAVEYDLLHPEKEENLAFPAHAAAYNGDLSHLKMLIETGVVSVNERNDKGSTPAHKAAGNGHVEVLQWLVEHGADLAIVNSAGETPKDVARRFGRLACVSILGGDSDNDDLIDEGANDVEPPEPQSQAEAKGRARRKMEELNRLLDVAKMNYQQLGGELQEDKIKHQEEKESARVIRELEAQLEYERVRREKLESESDKLRARIHLLNMDLEEMRNKPAEMVQAPKTGHPANQRRKSKKSKRPNTAFASGIHGFFQ